MIADDNHPQSPPMTILMTVRAINPLSITMPPGMQDGAQTLTLDRRNRAFVKTAIGVTGGIKPYRVEAMHRIREMRRANIIPSGVSVVISFNRTGAYTVSLRISDSAPGEFKTTQTVTLIYHVASRPSAKLTAPTIPTLELFAKNTITAADGSFKSVIISLRRSDGVTHARRRPRRNIMLSDNSAVAA